MKDGKSFKTCSRLDDGSKKILFDGGTNSGSKLTKRYLFFYISLSLSHTNNLLPLYDPNSQCTRRPSRI